MSQQRPNYLLHHLENSFFLKGFIRAYLYFETTLTVNLSHSSIFKALQFIFSTVHSNFSVNTHFLSLLTTFFNVILLFLLTFSGSGIIAAAILLLALYLVATLFLKASQLKPQAIHLLDILAGAYFLSLFVAACFSSYPHEALLGACKEAIYAAVYLVFRITTVKNPKAKGILITTLFILGATQGIIGLFQNYSGVSPLATWSDADVNPELQLTRVFGTLKPFNPNLYAGFLIPCLSAGFWCLAQQVSSLLNGLHSLSKRWPLLILSTAGLGFILAGLVLSGARGGYLGLLAMGLTLFIGLIPILWQDKDLKDNRWLKPLWLSLFATIIISIALALMFSAPLRHRILSIFAMREDSSISYRLNVYASSWRMALDNLWIGIGPGNSVFKQVYGIYMTPGYNALGTYSVPLEVLVEGGLLSLFCYGLLSLTLWLKASLALWEEKMTLKNKLSVLTLFAGVLGFWANGFFDTVWYRPPVQVVWWLWVALLALETPAEAFSYSISQKEEQKTPAISGEIEC